MDKQQVINAFLKKLREMRATALLSYESYRKASADAPGAMQSHSDTSKFQSGVLADGTMEQINQIDENIAFLSRAKNSNSGISDVQILALVRIQEGDRSYPYLVVPEGVGGQEIEAEGEKIKTVSIDSPLGKALIHRKVDDVVDLAVRSGKRNLKILTIE
jgi:transcription elongation GreA/GreB family factor